MILPSRSLFPTSNTTAMLVYTNCGPQGTPLVRLLLAALSGHDITHIYYSYLVAAYAAVAKLYRVYVDTRLGAKRSSAQCIISK